MSHRLEAMSRLLPRRPLPPRRTVRPLRGMVAHRRLAPARSLPPTPFDDLVPVWTFPPDHAHRADVLADFLVSRKVDAVVTREGQVCVPASQERFGTLCATSFMRNYDRSLAEVLREERRANRTSRDVTVLKGILLVLLLGLGWGLYRNLTDPYRRPFTLEDWAMAGVLAGGFAALAALWYWKGRHS